MRTRILVPAFLVVAACIGGQRANAFELLDRLANFGGPGYGYGYHVGCGCESHVCGKGGHAQKGCGHAQKGCGHAQKGCGLAQKGCGLAQKGCGLAQKGCGLAQKGCGGCPQKVGLGHSQKSGCGHTQKCGTPQKSSKCGHRSFKLNGLFSFHRGCGKGKGKGGIESMSDEYYKDMLKDGAIEYNAPVPTTPLQDPTIIPAPPEPGV